MTKNSKNSYSIKINGNQHSLSTEKILVGTSDSCDLQLDHDSVSNYHAMIFVNPDTNSLSIIDLQSKNGVYINGTRIVGHQSFFDGDTISLGKLHCEVLESLDHQDFISQDSQVNTYEDLQNSKVYIPQQHNETDVLIDDEYCDIIFDDEEFIPLHANPISSHKIDIESYVDPEQIDEAFDILQISDGNCIQVTTALHGSLLEQYYYPIQDGTIFASNRPKKNNVVIDILDNDKLVPLFKCNNGIIELSSIEGMSSNFEHMNLADNKTITLSRGTYQVFIEVAPTPSNLMHISSAKRDRAFIQDTIKKFSSVAIPMLLLLLVDFTIEKKKPLKQLSIIYKKPTTAKVDAKKMASTNPNSKDKNTGHKATKQPDKKISHSKSGKKAQPKKVQKVAKSQPKKSAAPKKTSKAKAKTKAYQFKMATNVSSVFSTSKAVAVSNSRSPSSVSTTASVSGSLATKVNGTSSSNIGNMGSDAAGTSGASFGSKGLSSKSGRDTAYIQTQTVVLGSMDPELLRKILQQYLPQFRHCYQQELAYNSDDIKGIVDLNFEISGSGKVGKIKVKAKDSRFSKRGTNCMRDVLAIIDFPKPKGGGRVAVRQPLSFFSEKERS